MIRIAITGPESTGKTTLSKALHEAYKCELVEEFAREYLGELNRDYEFEDLMEISSTHHENATKSQESTQIIDTDFILMKIWYDDKFGKTPGKIIEWINDDLFDLHILCAPDIPWEDDPLRENPNDRAELFERYIQELDRFKKKYIIVTGDREKRFQKSLSAIDAILK